MCRSIIVLLFLLFLKSQSVGQDIQYEIMVLGVSQDGGYPQAACQKVCCQIYEKIITGQHFVTSLAVIEKRSGSVWLIDCSPDFKAQWAMVDLYLNGDATLKGIFLTHAHIGHYLGLAQLGREVMGANQIPVYVMPKMKLFLENNGPWEQLVRLKNIELKNLQDGIMVEISEDIKIKPFLVPHRDEYSETVGYQIYGPNKTVTYIPDIDKWETWSQNLQDIVANSSISFIDATFYDEKELPGRDMSEIPHPFVVESMELLQNLSSEDKSKVQFIHMNHTNPLHFDSELLKSVRDKGFNVAEQGSVIDL